MMEDEIKNFMNICVTIVTSLTYCYFISSRIPKGKFRLLSILPNIFIFTLLPLYVSSVALQLSLGVFIPWITNFKLLLFAIGRYPLSSDAQSLSPMHFITITSLPIKTKQNSVHKSENRNHTSPGNGLNFVVITMLWSLLVHACRYKQYMNPKIFTVIYCLRMFYATQIIFEIVTPLGKLLLHDELEPPFKNPHLCTSIQDFWGRRWNLVTSCILRQTIYQPMRSYFTPKLGKRWALHLAIISTFAVSGAMHELTYFYVRHGWPTWEAMVFFVMQGVCVAIEIEVKKALGWKLLWLPQRILEFLTFAFIVGTSYLCYSELMKCGADVREIKEYMNSIEYVNNVVKRIKFGKSVKII